MTTYGVEYEPCFRPRLTTATTEATGCAATGEAERLSAWTDGTWWLDGEELVGWTDYPPAVDATPVAGFIGIEVEACFQPRVTAHEVVATGCFGLGDRDFDLAAPWSDGNFWSGEDGELFGWSDYPAQEHVDAANSGWMPA